MAARPSVSVAYYRVRYVGSVHVLNVDGRRYTLPLHIPREHGKSETYENAVDAMMTLLEENPPRDARDFASFFERVEIVTVEARTGHLIDVRTDADDSENLFTAKAEPYGGSRFFPSEIKGYRWKIDAAPGSPTLHTRGPRAPHRVGTRPWTPKDLPWSFEEALAKLEKNPKGGGAGQSIHLQTIGQVPAKPASEVKPGDILSWNQAPRAYVAVSVRPVSAQFVELVEQNLKTGQTFTRRLRKDKLVAAEEARPAAGRPGLSSGSSKTMQHLARWFSRKYGLSMAEATRMANRDNVEELERKHEEWRVAHGMPAANSPISRGKLQKMLLDGVGLSTGHTSGPLRGDDWTERYMITTSRGGRVWTREKLLTEVFREARKSTRPIGMGRLTLKQCPVRDVKARIEAVLDDDSFMRTLYGQIPVRVVSAVLDRIWMNYREPETEQEAGFARGAKPQIDPSRPLESNAVAYFFVGGNEHEGDPESIALRKGEIPLKAVQEYLVSRLRSARVEPQGSKGLLCHTIDYRGNPFSYTTPVKVEARR